MALDPRIPLMAQGINIEPRSNALLRAAQLQGTQDTNALRQMQMQQLRQAAEQSMMERQAAAQKEAAIQQAIQRIPSPRLSPLGGNAAPTQANAQRLGNDPRAQSMWELLQAGAMNPADYLKNTGPAARKLTTVSPGGSLVDESTGQAVFTAPDKPASMPSAVQEYEYAKGQGYKGTFEQWDTGRKKAGATNVSLNTGQRGLDNTLKLRGDFRQEPVYKAHQEMTSAHAQIKQALGQGSPAGDLAGATKIMKLLDPGSVVRESELGMAMQASGLMDRIQNYANLVVTGQKLTPTQRQDFQRLADALYSESVNQYNSKRQEYQGIAERNGLPTLDVLGPESKSPVAPSGEWSIKPKGGK